MNKIKKILCYFSNNINILKYVGIFGCLISIIVFTYFYVRNESPIYIFDYSGYFENFKLMGNLLFSDIQQFWDILITSIRNYDYNYSSVVLLMPFYKILGTSRLSYILGLTIMYVFPSIILITISFMNLIKDKTNKKENILYFTFTLLLTFMYTRLWSPTLRGLSDIIGLIPIIISYMMIAKRPLITKQKNYQLILLGVIVYLPFLFRRWYVYYIIGFCLSSFIIDFYTFFTKSRNKETFFLAFKNYFIFGMTILLLAVTCQLPLIKNILNQNYSDAYSGYQASLIGHFERFYNEFGLVLIILLFIGIILSIWRKKYQKPMIFSVLNIAIFWFLFGTVQNMGVHHYLGISFWVILLVFIGIRHIYEILPKGKKCFLLLIICLFALNFMTTYIFRDKSIPLVSQNNKYYKFRYYNFNELERLIHDAEILVKDKEGQVNENTKISVLADSSVISDNLLDLLGNIDIKDNIIYATHIDSRDGINFNSLLAKYIIVTSVSQLGTNSEGQYVLKIPNEMIYEKRGLGNAYKQVMGPYLLDNNVEAYIYEKTRNFSNEEVTEYFESFYSYYPNWKDKYNLFDKMILESNIYLGAYYGAFKKMDEDTYFFFPGFDNTVVSIPIDKKINSMKLKFYVDYKGNNELSGVVNVTIKDGKKELYKKTIDSTSETIVELDLKNKSNLTFEINGGKTLQDDWLMMDVLECLYN